MNDDKKIKDMTVDEIRACMGDMAETHDAEAMRDVLISSGCGDATTEDISEIAWLSMMDRAMAIRELEIERVLNHKIKHKTMKQKYPG